MAILEAHDHRGIFTSHAYPQQTVDLRGQGRSTWTAGHYTLDNMGNDLVRFLDLVIGAPVIASGNSSGGLLAAWLAAFARPGQVRGALVEDAPLFSAEVTPACGQCIRQGLGPMFALWNKWLGDQWTIGDWTGMQAAMTAETPPWMLTAQRGMAVKKPGTPPPAFSAPPQNMREYDPEWGRAFCSGTASVNCDHARMLAAAPGAHAVDPPLPDRRPRHRGDHGCRLRRAGCPGPVARNRRRPAVRGRLHA